jgi:hypothetical protein
MPRLHLPLDNDRERECKGRTSARLGLDPNPAPVHLNDALRDRESQPSAALLLGDGVVRLLKLLKQPGPIFKVDYSRDLRPAKRGSAVILRSSNLEPAIALRGKCLALSTPS